MVLVSTPAVDVIQINVVRLLHQLFSSQILPAYVVRGSWSGAELVVLHQGDIQNKMIELCHWPPLLF